MSEVFTRDDLVQRARRLPRSLYGALSALGMALTIGGLVVLIQADLGWKAPLGTMMAGVLLVGCAGAAIQNKFLADAEAAGFDEAETAAIEDEAERLNEEEA